VGFGRFGGASVWFSRFIGPKGFGEKGIKERMQEAMATVEELAPHSPSIAPKAFGRGEFTLRPERGQCRFSPNWGLAGELVTGWWLQVGDSASNFSRKGGWDERE